MLCRCVVVVAVGAGVGIALLVPIVQVPSAVALMTEGTASPPPPGPQPRWTCREGLGFADATVDWFGRLGQQTRRSRAPKVETRDPADLTCPSMASVGGASACRARVGHRFGLLLIRSHNPRFLHGLCSHVDLSHGAAASQDLTPPDSRGCVATRLTSLSENPMEARLANT